MGFIGKNEAHLTLSWASSKFLKGGTPTKKQELTGMKLSHNKMDVNREISNGKVN